MALTRGMLKGMGLTAEQESAIIEAHAETVDGLKAQIVSYKEIAEKSDDIKKELEEANKELESLKNGTDWKAKYDKEHEDFEAYKTAQADKEVLATKQSAYKALLKETGVSEASVDAIIKVTDFSAMSLDKEGNLKDVAKLTDSIKESWAGFITTQQTSGAGTQNPPANNGGSAFSNMSLQEKMAYANDNPNDADVVAWLRG